MGLQTVVNPFLTMEPLEHGVANSANQFLNMEPLEHGVANQFLNMEPLEYGVSNSCKSVFKYGTIGTWGCKQLQMSF